MAGYLWRRGIRFWFQIAIPSGARDAFGATPIRMALPCGNYPDASRYARRLAGIAEGWFMALNRERFSGLEAIAASSGNLHNPRDRLYNKLVAEIRSITSQVATLDDLRKPKAVRDYREENADLRRRNEVLESILASLDDKAKGLAGEYADFFEEVAHERNRFFEQARDYESEINGIHAEMGQELGVTQKSLTNLKDRVVAGEQVRNEVSHEALAALRESARLRVANEELTRRIDYRGPLLSEVKAEFLEDRNVKKVSKKLVADLGVKIDLFIALTDDKPVGSYRISDLQAFAARLSHLPQRHSVIPEFKGKTAVQLIKEHEKLSKSEKRLLLQRLGSQKRRLDPDEAYLTENTILNNFVGRVKTAIRWSCAEKGVDYPFRDYIKIVAPDARASVIRHGFSREQVNHLLSCAGMLKNGDEAWLPLVAILTGARIGELVMICPDDIRQRDGVWVVDLTRLGSDRTGNRRALKTQTSRRYLVLHETLVAHDFIRWAKYDDREWVFQDFHSAVTPASAASKRFQRLFKMWGLQDENVEVFHALRHTYKDIARAANIEERTIALQTGHSLAGVALNYGSKVLRPDEMQRLSTIPLPDGWILGPYYTLNSRISPRRIKTPKNTQRNRILSILAPKQRP